MKINKKIKNVFTLRFLSSFIKTSIACDACYTIPMPEIKDKMYNLSITISNMYKLSICTELLINRIVANSETVFMLIC